MRFAQRVSRSLRQPLVPSALALALLALASGASAFSYTFTTIDPPGALDTQAYGVNEVGQVAGSYIGDDGTGAHHGFLRDTDGAFTTIDVPGTQSTQAAAISGKDIVGLYTDANASHGFLATP